MRRIGIYFRSFVQSVKEKPLVFVIFVITIIMSVIISGTFYRLTKMQIEGFDEFTYYSMSDGEEIFDSAKLYENLPTTNIKKVRDELYTFKKTINEDGISVDTSLTITREYFASKYFSQDELNNKELVAVISFQYANWFETKVGDEISIGDEKFKVIRMTSGDDERTVYIPAACRINYDDSYKQSVLSAGCLGKMNTEITELISDMGLTAKLSATFNSTVLITILLSMGVIALSAVNIFMCNKFIAKKNSRRYTLFRIMGARGRDVAIMMALESLVVTIIAFIIGMFIDYGITSGLVPDYMSKLNAIDYVWLFVINISTVFLTTIVHIVKKITAQPQDAKQKGV